VKGIEENSLIDDPWNALLQQGVFRALMSAFAFPGSIEHICEDTDKGGTSLQMVLAALADELVTVADVHHLISESDWQKYESLQVNSDKAQFVVSSGREEPLIEPCLGSLENPEEGATLIICIDELGKGMDLALSGPGVKGQRHLAVSGLHRRWLERREEWNSAFPMGVDMILVDSTQVAALPRTTTVRAERII